MADVAFPIVDEARMSLSQTHPAQAIVRAEYTGRQHVANTGGPAIWRGSIAFAQDNDDNLPYIAEMTAFLAGLRGGANTFRIPIYGVGYSARQGVLSGGNLAVTSSVAQGDLTRVLVSGATDGIVKGDYVTIADRLYIVIQSLASGIMLLSPNAHVIPSGTAIEYLNPTLYARPTGELPMTTNHGNGVVGPWEIEFVENIA